MSAVILGLLPSRIHLSSHVTRHINHSNNLHFIIINQFSFVRITSNRDVNLHNQLSRIASVAAKNVILKWNDSRDIRKRTRDNFPFKLLSTIYFGLRKVGLSWRIQKIIERGFTWIFFDWEQCCNAVIKVKIVYSCIFKSFFQHFTPSVFDMFRDRIYNIFNE